ncbi:hypothetical protein GCM10023144_18580 [Pigmentiphaga soli]|uniref:Uncharacterized protein n=1 Tax=Pigmentiphaga soli TaxID=1007095 RepID=A0ABP8GVU3_9BURK
MTEFGDSVQCRHGVSSDSGKGAQQYACRPGAGAAAAQQWNHLLKRGTLLTHGAATARGAVTVIEGVLGVLTHENMRAPPTRPKGIGEIGIVGVNAAIANAVHHATGCRVRRLPTRIENLL